MSTGFNYMFFKLGRNKDLALLELSTILEKLGFTQKISYFQWKDFLFVAIEESEQHKVLERMKETGSVIKAGICFAKCSSEKEIGTAVKGKIIQTFDKFSKKKEKIKFSINLQIEKEKQRILSDLVKKEILKKTSDLRREVKILPKKGYSHALSPYQYHKENLPKRGIELIIFGIKSKFYLGETRWVSNPFLDIKLDEGRPERLFTHGTSIKMARSLINLAKTKKGDTIVDPFSGTGTILIMGLLQGNNAIGFEKDPKCVRVAKTNIRWAIDKYKIEREWKVYKADARDMHKIIREGEKVDAIVTEPYLGPFLKELPEKDEGKNILLNLEKLYSKVLSSSEQILKPQSYLVMIFPFYKYSKEEKLSIDLKKLIQGTSFIPLKASLHFNVNIPVEIGREHNIISREIVILQKTK